MLAGVIRAEFSRPRTPETVIGAVAWDGRQARIEAKNSSVRDVLARIFRPTQVVLDDESARPLGSRGVTVLEPGDLDWFLAAANVRSKEERLRVRFVTQMAGGWDPAGSYRPMRIWVEQHSAGRPAPAREELGTVTEA